MREHIIPTPLPSGQAIGLPRPSTKGRGKEHENGGS